MTNRPTHDTGSPTLAFEVVDAGRRLDLSDFRTVIAGYTGRDESAVRHHIDELAAAGVPEPDSVPAFFPIDSTLVTQAREIAVRGSNTSGEVEPVLVRAGGDLYLGLGSDHTDRDLERESVAASKAVCPKPLATEVVRLDDAGNAADWDSIVLRCRVDGDTYQEGPLAAMLLPSDTLQRYADVLGDDGEDLVMFLGTLPLIDGKFVAGTRWDLSLTRDGSTSIHLTYLATRSG